MKVPVKVIKMIRENANIDYLKSVKVDVLKNVLVEADKQYYAENEKSRAPLVSDEVYDLIKDYLESKDPVFVQQYLGHRQAHVASGAKVKLPVWMGSMDKKKNLVQPVENAVVSDKLDGVSCLIHLAPNKYPILYTRGNGEHGRNISHLLNYFNHIEMFTNDTELMVRGELLLKKQVFDKYRCDESNARNTVAGFVNSKVPDEKFKHHIDFVCYEVIKPAGMTPSEQFAFLSKNTSFKVVRNESFDLLDQGKVSGLLRKRKAESEYEMDGLIVASDQPYKQVTSGNPKHAFAYKENSLENRVVTRVSRVEWNVSKDGFLKPLVYFDPVTINNVRIEKATGHNAKFIVENSIGKGGMVLVERSGDVIPKIVSVEVPATPHLPDVPFKWNHTNTDIVLDTDTNGDNNANNDDLKLKQFEYMLNTLNFDKMGKGIIARLYAHDVRTIAEVFALTKADLLKIEGFKEKSAENLHASIQKRRKELVCIDYMVASNIFGRGLSRKNLEKIIHVYDPLLAASTKITVEQVAQIEGIGGVYAKQFVDALPSFQQFVRDNQLTCSNETKSNKKHPIGAKLDNKHVVFTGFRDKHLEECVVNQRGVVATTMSKKNNANTILVCKELDATNAKQVKAKSLSIPIFERADFEKQFCD